MRANGKSADGRNAGHGTGRGAGRGDANGYIAKRNDGVSNNEFQSKLYSWKQYTSNGVCGSWQMKDDWNGDDLYIHVAKMLHHSEHAGLLVDKRLIRRENRSDALRKHGIVRGKDSGSGCSCTSHSSTKSKK
jgi:hypothetical protein